MTITGIGRKAARLTACVALSSVLSLALTIAEPVSARQRSTVPRVVPEQNEDRPSPNETRPLPDIVARVQATPPYNAMDYIGVAGFENRTMIYVLRFLDGRQVVVVRVDARSGRIVGRGPR